MALSPIPGLHPVGRRLRPLRALRTLPQCLPGLSFMEPGSGFAARPHSSDDSGGASQRCGHAFFRRAPRQMSGRPRAKPPVPREWNTESWSNLHARESGGITGARFLRGWLTILCIAVCSRTLIAYPRQRGYCVFVSAPDGSPLLGPLAS